MNFFKIRFGTIGVDMAKMERCAKLMVIKYVHEYYDTYGITID